jgi:3-oxoacyl-[acyl-carrier protein] reductase
VTTSLSGRIAVVTGGGRGIGAAIASRLSSMGAQVVICGRDQARLAQTASASSCEALPCDVSDWNSVAALAEKIKQTHRRLDILVNNAGVADFGRPLHELPLERWEAMVNTNLRGVFYTIKAFTPLMTASGGGHIINISSIASKNALPNGAAYAATKWGLNGLSSSVAEELRASNIRVVVVCPGSTHTELSPHAGKDPRKMLQGDDVAHVVAMLVTQSENSFTSEVVIRPTKKP